MSYTLSKIRPDDRRGMAQVRALLEQEGISLDGNLDYTCGLFDEDDNLAPPAAPSAPPCGALPWTAPTRGRAF